MKKLLGLLIVGLMFISLASAADVAYVVKNFPSSDLTSLLSSNGYSYDLIHESNLATTNWSNYKLIIVNNEKFSNPGLIPVNQKPSVVLVSTDNGKGLEDWKWITGSVNSLPSNAPKTIHLWMNQNPLINYNLDFFLMSYGLSQSSSADYTMYYVTGGEKAAGMKYVYVDGWTGNLPKHGGIVMAIDNDALLTDNSKTLARGVYFGLPRADLWSSGTQDVFLASVDWTISGLDVDGDGHAATIDCNDNNPLVWQNLNGYLDSDEDGFGTGELVTICSGDSIPSNYADVAGDCVNDNLNINPGMQEIAYDGLDNDCSAGDLIDVDGDGHNAIVAGGDDCNDNNPNVFPGAENPRNNCQVDGPVQIKEIGVNGLLEWNEDFSKVLNMSEYFNDPEGGNLIYSVNGTSEDRNITLTFLDSVFVFTTSENWNGNDYVIFEISNGQKSILSRVNLFVNPVNDAPVLKETIGNADLSLETGKVINLNNYFSDIDSGTLEFGVNGNSDINVVIDNGIASLNKSEGWLGSEILNFSASDGNNTAYSNNFNVSANFVDLIPPVVESISPENESISDIRDVEIKFNVSDDIASTLECKVYLNGVVNKTLAVYGEENYSFEDFADGNYNWKVSCNDGDNNVESETRTFVVSAPDAPTINKISSKTILENQSLEFAVSASDPDEGDKLTLSADNLPSGASFNNETKIFRWTPSFSQSGSYNVRFIVNDSSGKTDSMNVLINVGEVVLPPSFKDADVCKVIDENIQIDIKNPDDGDDFDIGKDININLNIENNGQEDVKPDVTAYLYDLDKDEAVENVDDNLKVKEGKDEDLKLTLKVPNDIELDDDFALLVVAGEDDDKFCNQAYVEIGFNKEKHKVVINEVSSDRTEYSAGDRVNLKVDLDNIGQNDEDVYILVSNSALNLSVKSEKFEIKEDDSETQEIYFDLPSDEKGNYEFLVKAVYDGGNDETKLNLKVGETLVPSDVSSDAGNVGSVSSNDVISLNNPSIILAKKGILNLAGRVSETYEDRTPTLFVNLTREEQEPKNYNVILENNSFDLKGINMLLVIAILIVLILIMIVAILKRKG